MKRLSPLLLLGAVLLAGCGSQHDAVTTASAPPEAAAAPSGADLPHRRLADVQVTVVDGDTNARVRGARVTIGTRSARSDRHGVARVPLQRRSSLVTSAVKPGYGERSVRLSYRTHPKSTIRIYRRSLQWTMYGAGPARSQAQPALDVRPPFRIVWSRGVGGLVEFPAVVQDGVAYVANAHGTVLALDMRDGTVIWRHDTPHGKMASSPAVWRDELIVHGMDGHVWVLRRSDGQLLWHYTLGSPIESSPVVVDGVDLFGAWNGTITALDLRTHRVRWRYHDGCKITSSAAVSGPALVHRRLLRAAGRTAGRQRHASVRALRRRPGLRHPGRLGRPRLRAELDRRLPDRVLDGRAGSCGGARRAPTSTPPRQSPRAASSSAPTTASSTASPREPASTLWAHSTGGPISGAASVVDGVAYAGSFAHRVLGVDARSGRIVLDFPHGEYVPVSGSGQRLLLHGYSRIYAVVGRR